jgi:hypothetical protein
MAYATTQNIQEEFKSLDFTAANSAVQTTRVQRFIAEAEAEIDAKVGQVYNTPIDPTASPNSLVIVRAISIGIVAQRVRDILEVKSPDQETGQGVRKDSASDARKRLDAIVNRTLPLPDAVLKSSTNGATSFEAGDASAEFTFKRGSNGRGGPNQW